MKKYIDSLVSLSLLAFPSVVYAAPPKLNQIGGLLDNVMKLVTPVGAVLSVAMFVYGGYIWMMSAGDSSKVQQAQGTITWAVIGLIFLVIFRLVLKGIFDFIGN